MRLSRLWIVVVALVAIAGAPSIATADSPFTPPQEIPRTFDEEALVDYEVPPPDPSITVEHITPEYFYGIRERVIHKTFPMYHPDHEPEGYLDSLRTLEPATVLDTDTLDTDEEWVRAGEMVFDAPQIFFRVENVGGFRAQDLAAAGVKTGPDGAFPYQRYVVVAKGDVRVGVAACGNCHTRVLDDGAVAKGAQGDLPLDQLLALGLDVLPPDVRADVVQGITQEQFRAPWVDHPSQSMLDTLSAARDRELRMAIPAGVFTRQGTNLVYPTKIADLRGIRTRRFLDATGLVQHRSIGDIMRYAAFNQFVDHLNRYGDFVPSLGRDAGPLPPPGEVRSFFNDQFTRFTDDQAYALGRYLYSLEPLPSPHEYDEATLELGERVFIEQGCVTCHTPPDFTNNELTPATGFEPPDEHWDKYPIFGISVDTDPGLTLYTRRGTGYYKVPSLRGLWYRGRMLHDGSIASLEELLDPTRLTHGLPRTLPDGTAAPRVVVPGHAFGMELPDRERSALIAYLLTL
jgi:mono/diheme cytochrome c family protein